MYLLSSMVLYTYFFLSKTKATTHTRTRTADTMEMIKTLSVLNPKFFDGSSFVVPLLLILTDTEPVELKETFILFVAIDIFEKYSAVNANVSGDVVLWIPNVAICDIFNVEFEGVFNNDSVVISNGKAAEIDFVDIEDAVDDDAAISKDGVADSDGGNGDVMDCVVDINFFDNGTDIDAVERNFNDDSKSNVDDCDCRNGDDDDGLDINDCVVDNHITDGGKDIDGVDLHDDDNCNFDECEFGDDEVIDFVDGVGEYEYIGRAFDADLEDEVNCKVVDVFNCDGEVDDCSS